MGDRNTRGVEKSFTVGARLNLKVQDEKCAQSQSSLCSLYYTKRRQLLCDLKETSCPTGAQYLKGKL